MVYKVEEVVNINYWRTFASLDKAILLSKIPTDKLQKCFRK
jgi:hypothetical protein